MSSIPCIWPECENAGTFSRGFCQKHYFRSRRLGSFDQPWILRAERNAPKSAPCRWPGCDSIADNRGLCKRDYARAYRRQNFDNPWAEWADPGRDCAWPECDRSAESRGMCDRDYKRAQKVGTFDQPWKAWESYQVELAAVAPCMWPDCKEKAHARDLCTMHYQRAKILRDYSAPWTEWEAPKDCLQCGGQFRRGRFDAIYCGPKCSGDAYKVNNPDSVRNTWRKRRAVIKSVDYEKFTNDDVRRLNGDICYLCGKVIDFDLKHPHRKSPSLDHIVPISKGGPHSLGNAAMTHLVCNQRKSARIVTNGPPPALF